MGKGASPDVYQSPYMDEADQLAFQNMLGTISGQGISPSPALNSSVVAQQLGGKYNPKTGEIKFPDKTVIRYDPLTGQYVSSGDASYDRYKKYYKSASDSGARTGGYKGNFGGGARESDFYSPEELQNYVNQGGKVYDSRGGIVNFSGSSNPYLDSANEAASSLNESVYNNPSSAYNLFNSLGEKYYNAETGRFEDATKNADGTTSTPQGNTSDYYLDKYGGYLDKPYEEFDYQPLTNISDTARKNIYQRGADRIVSNYKDRTQDNENFISRRGSSLSSGRALALGRETDEAKGRELTELQRGTDTEHELRGYEDQKSLRDARAGEHRYGYETNTGLGREKLGIAEALDTRNRDQGFQELQANRQQNLSKITALLDMLRVYGGMDSTAAQLAASQAQSSGAALGGLLGGIGSAAGGAFSRS